MNKIVTLEELGGGSNSGIICDITFDLVEGEPMVRYYPDGSGYPGSPAYYEFGGVNVLNYSSNTVEYNRNDRPEWFQLLDKIAENYIEENWGGISEDF